jgi:protein-S-isoprenylcysteine O-methyltransferase Ste14
MKRLSVRAWVALAVVAAVMGLLLFVPAGTVHYWEAWVYLAIFTGSSALITRNLLRRDPALLERRMRGGPTAEKRTVQKLIMLGTSIGFIAILVVPALDHRFGWSAVPLWVVITGDVLVFLGLLLSPGCTARTRTRRRPSRLPRVRR